MIINGICYNKYKSIIDMFNNKAEQSKLNLVDLFGKKPPAQQTDNLKNGQKTIQNTPLNNRLFGSKAPFPASTNPWNNNSFNNPSQNNFEISSIQTKPN